MVLLFLCKKTIPQMRLDIDSKSRKENVMFKNKKARQWLAGVMLIPLLATSILWSTEKKEAGAEILYDKNVKLSDASRLNYKTAAGSTHKAFFFTIQSKPAFCLDYGEGAGRYDYFRSDVDLPAKTKRVLNWGYRGEYNEVTGNDNYAKEVEMNKILWKEFAPEGKPYDAQVFRYATQYAVWMSVNKGDIGKGNRGQPNKDKADVNLCYQIAKAIYKKAEKAEKPAVTGLTTVDINREGDKIVFGPIRLKANVGGLKYNVSIVDGNVNAENVDMINFYTGEFPKGFEIKAAGKTFKFFTKYSGDGLDMNVSERKKANKKILEELYGDNITGRFNCMGGDYKGNTVYIKYDADAKSSEVKALNRRIVLKAESIPQYKAAKYIRYHNKSTTRQDFAASRYTYNAYPARISLNPPEAGRLVLYKYPSDTQIGGGDAENCTDTAAWNKELEDIDLDEEYAASVQALAEIHAGELADSVQFQEAFLSYEKAVKESDRAAMEQLKESEPALNHYAMKDEDRNTPEAVADAYYQELAEEAAAARSLEVLEPPENNPVIPMETYTAEEEEELGNRINAKFLVRGPKGGFDDTKYSIAKKGSTYDYIVEETVGGVLDIAGIAPGKYTIAELESLDTGYTEKAGSNLHFIRKGKNNRTDITSRLAETKVSWEDQEYTGYTLEVKKENENNRYEYVRFNKPSTSIQIFKSTEEGAIHNGAFRIAGTTPGSSYYMADGWDDPDKEGGLNFKTTGGYYEKNGFQPGTYHLYEYRYDQTFTDENGEETGMDEGYVESSREGDTDKLLFIKEFVIEALDRQTSIPIQVDVINKNTPAVGIIKMEGAEFDEGFADYKDNPVQMENAKEIMSGDYSFKTKIKASFQITGPSFPDGKEFTTKNNTLLITNLLEGEYTIHETYVDGNQGFLLDDTEYHVTLDSSYNSDNPYIIIHPNRLQEPDKPTGEVHISKIDEFGMMLDHAKFSLAAYYGDYIEGFDNNDLTQPKESGRYTGSEFYDEGTVRYGQVIFDSIPCTVDGDNNAQTWVHIHEIETPDGSDPQPVDSETQEAWRDFADQCKTCQERREAGLADNGKNLQLTGKAYAIQPARTTLMVKNITEHDEPAYLHIKKTTTGGVCPVEGAEFELWTNPAVGAEQVPLGIRNGKLTALPRGSANEKNIVTEQNGNGVVFFPDDDQWLKDFKAFKLKEVKAPEGFLMEKEEIPFEMTPGGQTVVEAENAFENPYRGKLKLLKVAADASKIPLEGAVFKLYETMQDGGGSWVPDPGKAVQTGTSDANGFIEWDNLKYGSYYIAEEIQAPKGYEVSEASKNILLLVTDSDVPVEVFNGREKMQIAITKKDKDTGALLAGAEFLIRNDKNVTVDSLITDENGYAKSKPLERAAYKIVEYKSPDGYVKPDDNKVLAAVKPVDGLQTYTYEFTNEKVKGTLKIHKTSSNDFSTVLYPLAGAKFEVKRKGEDTVLDTLIIGEDGYSTSSILLEGGTYVVTEVQNADGYYFDKNGDGIPDVTGISQEVTIHGDEEVVLDFENEPIQGALKILKTDSQDGTKAVQGVVFSLYRKEKDGTDTYLYDLETNELGLAFSDVLFKGSYYVVEKSAPPGYWADPAPYEFAVTENTPQIIEKVIENTAVNLFLRIHKKDNKGQNVEGAGFTLYDANGDAVGFEVLKEDGDTKLLYEFFTDQDGMLYFPKQLAYGTYTLKETSTPPKYKPLKEDITIKIDSATKYIEIEIGKTVHQEVVNDLKEAGLKFLKIDGDIRQPLKGAEFILKSEENDYEETFITDENGRIAVTGLLMGEYIWTETKAPDGYPDSRTEGNVTIGEEMEYTITVENRKPGDAKVIKKDAKTGSVLPGAKFLLLDVNGKMAEGTTKKDGSYLFENLIPGHYTITETEPPQGYLLPDPATREFDVKPGETAEIVFLDEKEDVKKGKVKIIKKEEGTNTLLAGAKFVLKGADGIKAGPKTSNELGTVLFEELEPGTYTVTETKAPDGYELPNPASQTITIKAGETGTVTFYDEREAGNSDIVIYKKDADNGYFLTGAEFTLYDKEGRQAGKKVTDGTGSVLFENLKPGTYTVTETKAPKGYVLPNPSSQTITVKAKEKGTVTFLDEMEDFDKGHAQILKIDADTGEHLSGAYFTLTNESGRVVAEGKTDASGLAGFYNLKPGTYTMTEVTPPDGYSLSSPNKQTITVKAGETGEAVFKNVRKKTEYGDCKILKIAQDNGKPLPGAYFILQDKNGKKAADGISGEDGIVWFNSITPGFYTVVEVMPPSGYDLSDPNKKAIEVKAGTVTEVTFSNPRAAHGGHAKIEKVDMETGEHLKGAVFVIEDLNGREVCRGTTDQNGLLFVSGLDAGTYIVTEIKAPKGYLVSGIPLQRITIQNGETTSILFRDRKDTQGDKGSLRLLKRDRETGRYLDGAVFEVTGPSGSSDLYTIKNGCLELGGLMLGEYTIREVIPPSGYTLPEIAEQRVFLSTDGQVITVTFMDERTPKDGDRIFILYKRDGDTKRKLPGCIFTIYDLNKNPITAAKTDKDGIARFTLPAGTYYYRETLAPEGYQKDLSWHTINLTKEKEASVTMDNHKGSGKIKIYKLDADTRKPIEGCIFGLYDSSGNLIMERMTQKDGTCEFDVPYGSYRIKEQKAAKGYASNSEKREITVDKENPICLETVYNKRNGKGKIIIHKQDINDSKINLPDTLITIRSQDNNEIVLEKRTDAQGNAYFSLTPGKYTYQESEAPEGYLIDETPHPFEIKETGEIIRAVMFNVRLPIVRFIKMDAETGELLPGAVLEVLDENREVIKKWETGRDGSLELLLEPEKNYYYQEIKAPDGYKLDRKLHKFQAGKGGEVKEISIYNEKVKGSILPKTGSFAGYVNLPALIMTVLGLGFFGFQWKERKKKKK